MFVSSPFALPLSAATPADSPVGALPVDPSCEPAIQSCPPGKGSYPLTASLGWHGGTHLIAPRDDLGQAEPVRAMAAGVVVYARPASPEQPALSFGNARTDNGCVVLKHVTEIGTGDEARVTFFSIYMHLQSLAPALTVGQTVSRQAPLGVAGQVYGQPGQLHFEIVCDKANLRKLIGRDGGPLAARSGRRDAVYGDVWFKVPAAAQGSPAGKVFVNRPHPYRLDDSESSFHTYLVQQAPLHCLKEEWLIRMRYDAGLCHLTTFVKQSDGRYEETGTQTSPGDAPDLMTEVRRLHTQYADLNGRLRTEYASKPAPSALYDMLRFGRVLGPDALPANGKFGHWRLIHTPSGAGWINLNLPAIGVYSDADFPHWAGWTVIDDDAAGTSQCASATVRAWPGLDETSLATPDQVLAALQTPEVCARSARAICRFPVEWSRQGTVQRWRWLAERPVASAAPLTEEQLASLCAHLDELAFWEDIEDPDLPPATDCWHFPPAAFIEHFTRCSWLSRSEFEPLLPESGEALLGRYYAHLNHTLARYLVTAPHQRACFLASYGPASRQLRELDTPYEGDPGAYFQHEEAAGNFVGWLGNVQRGDGARYRARGFGRLHGRAQYAAYFCHRGWLDERQFGANWWRDARWWGFRPPYAAHHADRPPVKDAALVAHLIKRLNPPMIENPDLVLEDDHTCIDTAGYLWVAQAPRTDEQERDTRARSATRRPASEKRGAPAARDNTRRPRLSPLSNFAERT
jgi:hydroxyethylthiazole kinase